MDEKLREAIGRALYNASFDFEQGDMPTWDELTDEAKEQWIARAEKVVEAYKHWIEEQGDVYLQAHLKLTAILAEKVDGMDV